MTLLHSLHLVLSAARGGGGVAGQGRVHASGRRNAWWTDGVETRGGEERLREGDPEVEEREVTQLFRSSSPTDASATSSNPKRNEATERRGESRRGRAPRPRPCRGSRAAQGRCAGSSTGPGASRTRRASSASDSSTSPASMSFWRKARRLLSMDPRAPPTDL